MKINTLKLKRQEERRLRLGHLWIYSNEVDAAATPLTDFSPGEQVRVESHSGKFLGIATINPKTLLCGRLVSLDDRELDKQLLVERLESALKLRNQLFDKPFYRLVYSEGDFLPGLIVDRFGPHLAVQFNTCGMERLREQVIDSLMQVINPTSILLRNDSGIRVLEGLPQEVTVAYGTPPEEVVINENGVEMVAPFLQGQKTGWFFDQRLNRAWLQNLVKGKKVLDAFSYVGGFATIAAASGASTVVAVDSSRQALLFAERNVCNNSTTAAFSGLIGDGFQVLKGLYTDGERYDVVVVDPPAFIKRKKDHREGLQAYKRIVDLAMQVLAPDGLLLAASCSMHLAPQELQAALLAAAVKQNRHLQILREGSQGPDHPVHPAIAETRYLKAFLARIT